MISRDLLVKRALERAPLYGLAPKTATSALANLGSAPAPAAILKNGASLSTPGLLKGGASAVLDGVNDYVESGWLTRTNLVPTPNPDNGALGKWDGVGAFFNNAATVSVFSLPLINRALPELEFCVKTVTPGVATVEGCRQTPITVEKGKTYRYAIYLRGNSGGEKIRIAIGSSTVGSITSNQTLTAGFIRYDVSFTATESGTAQIAVTTQAGETKAITFYAQAALVEEAATVGTYLPLPSELTSGLAGWSGTAYQSASDAGPFARGTRRTFVGVANRTADADEDTLFGGGPNPVERPLAYIVPGNTVSYFNVGKSVGLGAWPGTGRRVVWAIADDRPGETVEMFIDGISRGQKAVAGTYPSPGGDLQIGTWATSGSPFGGSVLPFFVFGQKLAEEELLDLLRPARATRITAPVDDRLFVKLKDSQGKKTTWRPDHPDASGIPEGITLADSAPGGHRDSTVGLVRDPRRSWPDLNLVDEMEIYGRSKPLGRNAFEGQIQHMPSQLGDTVGITVNAVGNQIQLGEDESFQALYVALGFAGWEGPPLYRREALANSGLSQGKIPASVTEGGLVWDPPAEALPANEITELWYSAPAGIRVAKMDYRGLRKQSWAKFEIAELFGGNDQNLAGVEGQALTLDNTIRTATFSTPHRYAALRARVLEGLTPAAGTQQSYDRLALYGDHGLTLREIEGQPHGLYPHDVLAHMIDNGALGLDYTTGGSGSIVPNTSFVIPHLAFLTRGKVSEAIEKLNAYFLNNWAVWDKKRFHWHPWDPEKLTWEASVSGGAHWSPAGFQAETLLNGLIVGYTDTEGVSRTAGPPGSGCDYESALLQDSDPNNPYTRQGRRRWGKLDVGFPLAYPTTAFQVGHVVMLETKVPQRSGTLVIRPRGEGHVPEIKHPTAGRLPIWSVRSGEYVRLRGWPDSIPFRIIEKDYSHDSKTLTLQLDSGSGRISALLERGGSRLTA